MGVQEKMESVIAEFPVCEYAFIETKDIPFSDRVLYICEHECQRYGKSWACPPYVGPLKEGMEKCQSYQNAMIFSTVVPVADACNNDECTIAKREHEAVTRDIVKQLRQEIPDIYALSTGCTICEQCACPNEPCRHPEERISSTESHGIIVMLLAEQLGLTYYYDGVSVVYFTILFFNDDL